MSKAVGKDHARKVVLKLPRARTLRSRFRFGRHHKVCGIEGMGACERSNLNCENLWPNGSES